MTPDRLTDLLRPEMPRRSYQEIADDFEYGIRALLKKAGFENVAGGRKFFLGPNQIDACGGHEDTLLVVECKTSGRDGPRLLNSIRALRGQIDSIRTAARKQEEYKRYKKLVFIIATDFIINKRDRTSAGRKIQLWDRAFTDYYQQLASKLGPLTKFNILGELGLKPRQSHEECIPCIKHKVRNVNLFVFVAEPESILRWAYVARREIGKEFYYQRFVEGGKINGIASYIKSGAGYFPNAAVLAFNKKPKFRRLNGVLQKFPDWARGEMEFGMLLFPPAYRSCLIIDGQHRMYGAAKVSRPRIMMPMVALERASIEHQARLFLDINKNQKQVPSDLVWDLEGEMRPDGDDGVISRVAKALNRKGPLKGKVYVPEEGRKRRGQLKLSGICTAILNQKLTDRVLKNKVENPLYHKNPERRIKNSAKAINQALLAIDVTYEAKQKREFWSQNSGIAILLALVGRIAARLGRKPALKDYRKYFKALKSHLAGYRTEEQLEALRQRCNSEGGREGVVAEFIRAMSKALDDEDLSQGLPIDKLGRRIAKVERGLANLVAKVLEAEDANWLTHRVPEDIRARAQRLMLKENAIGSPSQDYFTFGETVLIAKRADNWDKIRPHLIVKGSFNNVNQLDAGAQYISDLRGPGAHGRGHLNEHDEAVLHGFLGKFERILSL